MTVLLMILKIIGILLLVILGVLLAVLLIVLFVPVRYCAEGEYQEKLLAKGQLTWLLHLLSVRFSFEGELRYSVKIAGIPFLPKREKKEAAKDKASAKEKAIGRKPAEAAKENKEEPGENPAKVQQTVPPKAKSDGSAVLEGSEPEDTQKTSSNNTEQAGADVKGEPNTEETNTEEVFGLWEGLLKKVYAIFRKYREKYEAICAKIKKVKDKLSRYIRILKKEETQELLRLTVNQLRRIFRHVLPRKLDVRLHIGTGDPASTGQILALQGVLYPILRGNVCIIPDFEEKHFEGTFYMKGRLTAFVLLLCALRVIINKNFRELIRILRKKEDA